MSRLVRTTLVSVCAAAALVASPAADAAVHGAHGVRHHPHDTRAESAGHHGARSTTTQLTRAEQQVLRQAARLDARLAGVPDSRRVTALDADAQAALAGGVAADRAALADLTAGLPSATTVGYVRTVSWSLRAFRPEVYALAAADVRAAGRLADRVSADDTALAAVTDRDVSAGVADDQAASAAVAQARAEALALTARSTWRQLRAAHLSLSAARQALAAVEAVLAGDDATDPTDPIGTDPTDPVGTVGDGSGA